MSSLEKIIRSRRAGPSVVKLDKKFIELETGTGDRIICVDQTDQHIVKTIIELAHALDMQVVVEGVDSEECLAMVRDLGCERAQGFFIARPMRSDLVKKWVDDYSRVTLAG